ncbi:MAG: peptide deformylase, partial [Streptomycetaceae bacterium]|nr:peptide deformylase [Streptomycetaceae bacterium]
MSQQDTEHQHDEQQQQGSFFDDVTDAAAREEAHRARGTAKPITVVGNPVLQHPCRIVTEFDDSLVRLIDDMFASQRAAEGVGLAANQIGVDLRVFVYDCPDDDGRRHVGHIVNPVLDELPADQRVLDDSNEGCLSVPGAYMELARPDYAVVRGQDLHGNPVAVAGSGYFARCLQHETDHLYGYLYIDRLSKRDRKDV